MASGPDTPQLAAPLLAVRGLRVDFETADGTVAAVRGIDLDVAPRETVAIVGESGSGKTTIGRTLVGLIKPTVGELLYDGADIGRMDEAAFRPLRSRIQMIFQDPQSSLNPRLTLGSIVARPLEAFGKAGNANSGLAGCYDLARLN